MDFTFTIDGLSELQDNIKRNPQVVKDVVNKFLVRATAKYKSIILNNPWRMGMSGGGAPTATGNLRDTHETVIKTWEAYITPTAPYAKYIHGVDGYPRKRSYQLRPWLEYAFNEGQRDVEKLESDMMDEILRALAK